MSSREANGDARNAQGRGSRREGPHRCLHLTPLRSEDSSSQKSLEGLNLPRAPVAKHMGQNTFIAPTTLTLQI